MQHNPKKSMFERNQDFLMNLKWSKCFIFSKEDDRHIMYTCCGQCDLNSIMHVCVIMNDN